METNSTEKGEAYYQLIGKKDAEGIQNYLHPHVEFHGPLAKLQGRDAVIQATCNFMQMFDSLSVRSKFGNENQAMIVYDIDIPGINKKFPGASLLTFYEGFIKKIELFYDGSPFIGNGEKIFSS